MRRALAAVAAAVAVVAAVVGLVAAVVGLVIAGDSTRRPEGAAERLLHALSVDQPDRAAHWADPTVTDALVDFDADDDTRFATIEVGRAMITGNRAVVPARVVRNDPADTAQHLQLTAQHRGDSWRITAIDAVATASVPSSGGDRPARAPVAAWAALAATTVTVAAGGDALITRLRRAPGGP